jgi:hypothetical protein
MACLSVARKRSRDAGNIPVLIDVFENLIDLPDAESFLPEHVAECALIVGTAQGGLYQHTVGLWPGAVYFAFVVYINFPISGKTLVRV